MKFSDYRVAKQEELLIMDKMKGMFLELALFIGKNCPCTDLKSETLNMLLKTKMMANASLLINTDLQTEIG